MITTTAPKTAQETRPQETRTTTRCISAVFKTHDGLETAIRRLLDRDISRENISALGKNFQSETRIAGFLTRKDVILDGLKSGAIFGSLFGSVLSLLSGVGVLFIPFMGSVVTAGPLGSVLLGAASGAIAGSAGAGIASALISLGMPEGKAAVYQTRLQAGEFLLIVEVPEERSGEFQLLLESVGGEEVAACNDMEIPRQPNRELGSPADLSPEIRNHLSDKAQETFVQAYNQAFKASEDGSAATLKAWQAIEQQYERNDQGVWSNPTTA